MEGAVLVSGGRGERGHSRRYIVTLHTLLIAIAFILFVLAGFGVGASRVQLGWFGLACVVLLMFVVL